VRDDEVAGHAVSRGRRLVRVWADGPTRHDAGKARISASSRTHVHVAVHTGLRPDS
jgi:hypothetical protein